MKRIISFFLEQVALKAQLDSSFLKGIVGRKLRDVLKESDERGVSEHFARELELDHILDREVHCFGDFIACMFVMFCVCIMHERSLNKESELSTRIRCEGANTFRGGAAAICNLLYGLPGC
jgi:hypothetical protein